MLQLSHFSKIIIKKYILYIYTVLYVYIQAERIGDKDITG